jgi:signal transduction histidine kinase
MLRPIDRMRAQASAITASGLDRRLTVPPTRDEIHRLAGTLNDMLGRLASAMAGERAFLERASHELRTPLSALRAEIDLALRRDRSATELTAALQSVSQETDRLARLADDLLVLARAADGRLAVRTEPVNLQQLLQRAADSFAAQAQQQSVSVGVDAPDTEVELDPVRMRQALSNLLANALEWTPAGGSIDVIAVVDERHVRITVSDTGPGLADDAVHSPGLGLKIVRAVVAAHRGTVTLGASASGGTRVELAVPRLS